MEQLANFLIRTITKAGGKRSEVSDWMRRNIYKNCDGKKIVRMAIERKRGRKKKVRIEMGKKALEGVE